MLKNKYIYKIGVCLLWVLFLNLNKVDAQIAINTTGAAPAASAVLDVSSTNMGFLMPRMSTAQMNAIKGSVTSLVIYNTTTNCYMFYTGSAWQSLSCTCTSAPASPGAITQSPSGSLSQGTTSVTFSVIAVSGVIYNWSVPSGYVITSGQGTNSIVVTIGCISGNVSVTAENTCGLSPVSTIAVTLTAFSKTYTYTGAVQTLTIPPCITTLTIDMAGAQGGCDYSLYSSTTYTSSINWGARLQSVVSVTPGTVLNIYVGAAGANGTSSSGGTGGTNGSGDGTGGNGKTPGATDYGNGGGGGASSEIWINATRCLVAGGGGGMGYSAYCMAEGSPNLYSTLTYSYDGGSGGQSGSSGLAYSNNYGNAAVYPNTAGAASNKLQSTFGATAGTAGTNSASGVGGNGGQDQGSYTPPPGFAVSGYGGGGGGGGGYAGGGGGCGAGGGGGSSYSQSAVGFTPSTVTYTSGFEGQATTTPGSGYITISY
jgi:hypothetical protein